MDREAVERAVRGQQVTLSPTELRLAILLRRDRYQTGLSELAAHFSYSRSSIAEIIANHRPRR